jgi:DNA-directed RNA polymerase specialized sigma24 family protein
MDNADAYIFQMAANLLRDRGRRERVRANYRASVDAGAVDQEPLDPARMLLGREAWARSPTPCANCPTAPAPSFFCSVWKA